MAASLLPSSIGGLFVDLDVAALITYRLFTDLEVGVGPGVQYWLSNGGFSFQGTAGFTYFKTTKWFGLIDRLFLTYNLDLLPGATNHQAIIGVGFSFN